MRKRREDKNLHRDHNQTRAATGSNNLASFQKHFD